MVQEAVGRAFLMIVIGICACTVVSAIVLDCDVEKYVNNILKEFDQDCRAGRFDNVIEPPVCPVERSHQSSGQWRKKDFYMPRIFIWCPIAHIGSIFRCPEHGGILEIGEWTNVLSKRSCYRNPRLVYAVGGNVILIQRVYVCRQGGIRHFYLSASKALMTSASKLLLSIFPFKLYHRAACTKQLLEYTGSLILGGVNFLKISETIASMNYKSYCHRGCIYLASLSGGEPGISSNSSYSLNDFYGDVLFSFPSANLLIYMYLEHFQEMRPFYEYEMSRLSASTISCDHTFKVSKNIVAFRSSGNKFVSQFQNLFIVLNDQKEVIEWRFAKTCAFEEIRDLLETLYRRPGVQLKCIYLDDCCKMRRLYQEIFSNVPVKLDVFHAVQRVTNTIPKGTELSRQLSKEFGLIFRADGDLGESRCLPTPEIGVIQMNLKMFLDRWQLLLQTPELDKTRDEIDKISIHISEGCLSGIEPGNGTEGNEALHHLLNRSLLCGSSILGPELALAILTELLYAYNCKRRGEKHNRNAKVTPVLPVEGLASLYHYQNTEVKPFLAAHFKMQDLPVSLDGAWTANKNGIPGNSSAEVDPNSSTGEHLLIADEVEHLFNDSVAKNVIDDALKLHEVFSNLNSSINDRSVDAFDFLFKGISEYNKLVSTGETQVDSETHRHNLQRNLSSMGLEVDRVSGDGDCAFSSIIRQLYKLPEFGTNGILIKQLQGIGLCIDEKTDTFTLRQQFVDHVQSSEHYQLLTGISADKLNEETELFREKGTFCGNLGDLVIKVCSDILRIPVLVITSLAQHRFVPFIPDDPLVVSTIYIVYNSYGAGHYDGVQFSDLGNALSENPTSCSCGKNKSRGSQASCQQLKDKTSGCPCVKKNICCTRKCKCRNCKNPSLPTVLSPPSKLLRCRCGESTALKKDTSTHVVSCRDKEKRSKCPCLGSGQGCSDLCRCFNCANIYGVRIVTELKSPERKKRTSETGYKRSKSCDFLAAGGFAPSSGPWNNFECAILATILKVLSLTLIAPTAHNISKLFNYVVASSHTKAMPVQPSSKTMQQISAKLAHLERKKVVSSAR